MAINEDLLVSIKVKFAGAADVSKAAKQINELAKAETKAVDAGENLAKTLAKELLPMVSLGAAAAVVSGTIRKSVQEYAKFETALVGVGKTTDMSVTALSAFGRELQGLSEKIPVSASDLASIAQTAGALGVRGSENLLNFTDTIAKLSAATDLVGEEGAASLKRLLDLTNESVGNIDELGSAIVALGNNFATTESKIVRTSTELGKAIGIFGVSSSEIVGMAAAMSSLGISFELGSSVIGRSFRAIDEALRKGGAAMDALQKITGETRDELTKTFQRSPIEAFSKFLEGLKRIQEAGGSVAFALEKMGLAGDEVNKTLPVMASRFDLVSSAVSMANTEFDKNSALTEEASRAFDTLASDMQLTANAVDNAATAMGAGLAPALREILKLVRDTAEGLKNFFDAVSRLGLLNTLKSVGGFQALNDQIKSLISKNNELAAVIDASKKLGPDASTISRFSEFLSITKDVVTATKLASMSQEELERAFFDNASQISAMDTQAQKLADSLLGVKRDAAQTKTELDRLGSKKIRPDIKVEVNTEEIKKGLELLNKIEDKYLSIRQEIIGLSGDKLAEIQAAADVQFRSLKAQEEEVRLSEKLSAEQKKRLLSRIEETRLELARLVALQKAKTITELANEAIGAQLSVLRDQAELDGGAMEALKFEWMMEEKVLDSRIKSLDIMGEQYSQIRAIWEATRDLAEIRFQKRKVDLEFEQGIEKLPEIGQAVAKISRDFLQGAVDALPSLSKILGEKFIVDLSLGLGAFSSSLEGMFAVSGKVLGDTIRYAILDLPSDLDNALGSTLGESWESLKEVFTSARDNYAKQWSGFFDTLGGWVQEFDKSVVKLLGLGEKPPGEIATEEPAEPTWFDDALAGVNKAWETGVSKLQPVADWFGDKAKASFDFLGDVFDKAWAKVPDFDQIVKGLGNFLGKFGGAIGTVADGLVSSFATIFDPDAIKGLADSMLRIVDELPNLLIKAFGSLTKAFERFASNLPNVVTKLMDGMNVLIQRLVDAAPAMIAGLMEGLNRFLDRLTDIAGRILDKLPDILSSFLKRLPETISKFFSAIGGVLAQIIKAFPSIINEFFEAIPSIVESFITGLIDAIGMVAAAFVDWFISGGAEKMVASFYRMVPRLVVAIVRGIIVGLAKGLGRIFGGFKIPDAIGKLPQQFVDGMRDLARSATEESSQLFRVLDMRAEARGMDAAQRIRDETAQAMTRIGEKFKGLLGLLMKSLEDLKDTLDEWFDKIGDLGTKIWNAFIKRAKEDTEALLQIGGIIWDGFLRPMMEALGGALLDLGSLIWEGFVRPFNERSVELALQMGSMIWEGFIRPLLERGRDALENLTKDLWPPIPGLPRSLKEFLWPSIPGLPKSLKEFSWPVVTYDQETFRQMGGKIWDGLKSSLLAFDWGSLGAQIFGGGGGGGGGSFVDKILGRGALGGLVTPGGIKYMAAGGLARGIDTVPAMLAPGEFVLNRGAVSALGLDNVRKINRGGGAREAANMTNNYAINVDISFDGLPDENFVRSKLIPEIKKEIKKASLKGELLISNRGVF